MSLQGEPGDPMWEALWARARFEQALLWMAGGLAAGFLPALFMVSKDAMLAGPRVTATVFGLISFGLPLVSFRGWARDRARIGTVLAAGAMALGVWMTTGKPLLTLVATALALGGALRAYAVYRDADHRPHMMQAAIEKARTEFGRTQKRQEG